MSYFLILLFWTIFFAIKWESSGRIELHTKDLIFLFLPFFIIHAFLDGYSIDDIPNYYDVFDELKLRSIKDILNRDLSYGVAAVEMGWLMMTKVISIFTESKQVLLIVDSFIILYCYAYLIKKVSYAPWLSALIILCTIYPQSLLVLRQHTAMAICMLAIPYIYEQKLLRFLGIVILATLFHNTAACFFPLYFLYKMKINKRFYIALVIIEVIIFFSGTLLLSSLMTSGLFTKDYANYFEKSERLNNYTGFIISLSELLFFIFFIKPNKKTEGKEKVLYCMLIVSVMFTALGGVLPIGGRLSKYFSIANIYAMPLCLQRVSYKNRQLLGLAISLLYIAFALINNQWSKPWLCNMKMIFE